MIDTAEDVFDSERGVIERDRAPGHALGNKKLVLLAVQQLAIGSAIEQVNLDDSRALINAKTGKADRLANSPASPHDRLPFKEDTRRIEVGSPVAPVLAMSRKKT